ncbi:MAG: hypothetical protein CR982_07605 [Candidatus Cloacimonadota bacterium]|nr:MAG: hypothetical protein CR982_07605 [Candidatus Cloacimonadota bacterium]
MLNEFKVGSFPLDGRHIIEASAGTGKTYSIGIIVLRLLLEKGIEIKNIILVTFTNAATDELSERVRIFLKKSKKYFKTGNSGDSLIDSILSKYEREKSEKIIDKSLENLDEISISTIHGFCKKVMKEFAFETGEILDNELILDQEAIIDRAINKVWRKEIVTLPFEEIEVLLNNGLKRDDLKKVVNNLIQGITLKRSNKTISFDEYFKIENRVKDFIEREDEIISEHKSEAIEIFSNLKTTTNKLPAFAKKIVDALEKESSTKPMFTAKGELLKQIVKNEFLTNTTLVKLYLDNMESQNKLSNMGKDLLMETYYNCSQKIVKVLEKFKEDSNILSQDDLILHLYRSVKKLEKEGKLIPLQNKLSQKYKAVAIDEFQDTDKKQYTIFSSLFNKEVSIFLIGDPKQSIYGWRGADLDTYLEAQNSVDDNNKFTMRTNFRSTSRLIEKLNSFFSINNPFFHEKIKYEIVQSGKGNEIDIKKDGEIVEPLSIINCEKSDNIALINGKIILDLLTSNYTIGRERVKPKNIGVVVRSKKEAKEMNYYLSKFDIPSVIYSDEKIIAQGSTHDFIQFLSAVADPTIDKLKRALITNLTSYTSVDILKLNEEKLIHYLEVLRRLNRTSKGIFYISHKILEEFDILSSIKDNREREIANLYQLIEILNSKERSENYTINEIIDWVIRVREGEVVTGDQYEQRIENDFSSVEISTIHKSKGLAYDIVFAPYLELTSKTNMDLKYKVDGKQIISLYKDEDDKNRYKVENERENRRIIYVALTRAKYKIFITSTGKESSLSEYISKFDDRFENISSNDIENIEISKYKEFDKEDLNDNFQRVLERSFKPQKVVSSFSAIDGKEHLPHKYEKLEIDNYDKFIFQEIGKGPTLGNFLHEIFENSDFTDKESYGNAIKYTKKRYPLIYRDEYFNMYKDMLNHVLNGNLYAKEVSDEDQQEDLFSYNSTFRLSEVSNRLNEMEFFYKVSIDSVEKIEDLLKDYGYSCKLKKIYIEGAFNGFIDLVFKYKDKFYILDWKSNYLGDSIENYSHKNINIAMDENNYKLQYLIYTIALKRYLESMDIDFYQNFGGVYYLFLRGIRKGKREGIYFDLPPKELIEKLDILILGR